MREGGANKRRGKAMHEEEKHMASFDDKRARFEWKTFGRTLVVWTIDFILAAGFVVSVWCFVYHCVFGGSRIEATAHEVSEIVSAIAWPVSLILLVLLFRNPLLRILNEVPTFVKRSYYRRDDGGQKAVMNPSFASRSIGDCGARTGVGHNRGSGELEKKVAEALIQKYGGEYTFEMCVGERRWMFDIVIESGNHIYGVEIKKNAKLEDWKCVFDRVGLMYKNYDDGLKCRFVFVAVIADKESSASSKIEREVFVLAQKREYVTFVERIPYDG